ncbi:Helix-turn-helix of DDE superfamily endonuclease [Popillia japonica]|uniref:Helix-turn-helix of DDE superfamily endonuclease n=1 Tax=Popillia japonica TaxID=7064 RepID=A0AAW1KM43_POPJA
MWIRVLKLGKKPSDHMRVCSLHFDESDFMQKERVQRRTLKSRSVPFKNLPKVSHDAEPGPFNRIRVSRTIQPMNTTGTETTQDKAIVVASTCENDMECEDEEDREAAETLLALFQSQNAPEVPVAGPSQRDCAVQVNTPKVLTLCELITTEEKLRNFPGIHNFDTPKVLTLCELITTEEKLRNFPGIHNFDIFNSIVEVFEMHSKDKRSRRLNVKQSVMLLLTKFKTSLTYVTLSCLFGISPDLTKTYIFEMIPVLAKVLKPLIYFPSKSEIMKNIPVCFTEFQDVRVVLIYFPSKSEIMKNIPVCFTEFQDVRVVLDCTEIFVQSPKCLCCRIRFYSQYKSHVTVKFMTGVSPGGIITYISKPYGGRASDKAIFEESNVISLLDPNRDAIMVDAI